MLPRIGRGREHAFIDFAIPFLDLRPLIGVEFLQIVDIAVHGLGEIAELEGQHVRIRQPHHRRAGGLRQRAAVDEIGVGEMRVPVEIVVNGMINAASAAFPAEAEIDRRDAQMVDERRVIRTRPKRPDPQIGTRAQFPPSDPPARAQCRAAAPASTPSASSPDPECPSSRRS